jgi:hypothetical protein
MAERFDFSLGTVEASVVGRALGVDIRQFPLRIGNVTVDPVRFAHVAAKVFEALELQRLSISGELHPSVRMAFELLRDRRVSVSINGIDGLGGDIAVLVVTDGAQALGITQAHREDVLQFALFADEDLVDVLSGVLPAAEAATTGAHTVEDRPRAATVSAMTARRQAEAEADDEETDAFGNIELRAVVQARPPSERSRSARVRAARPRPQSEDSAEVLERVLSGRRMGGGQVIATGYGRRGEILTANPLSWLDTEYGRYLVWTDTDDLGTMSAHYEPAGRTDVGRAILNSISSIY